MTHLPYFDVKHLQINKLVVNIIENTLATICVKFLGGGSFGKAFLTSEGTVAKITSSVSETAMMYLKMTNNDLNGQIKGLERICKVYGIWRLKSEDTFLIEKEYIPQVLYNFTNDERTDLGISIVELMDELESNIKGITDTHMGNVGLSNNSLLIFDCHIDRMVDCNVYSIISDIQ